MLDETILKTTLGPFVTGAASFLFGVPVATLIAGFAGSWLAIAMGQQIGFRRAACLAAVGTLVAGYLTPGALFFIGELPQRPAAAIIGFLAIHKDSRQWMIERVKTWFSR